MNFVEFDSEKSPLNRFHVEWAELSIKKLKVNEKRWPDPFQNFKPFKNHWLLNRTGEILNQQ